MHDQRRGDGVSLVEITLGIAAMIGHRGVEFVTGRGEIVIRPPRQKPITPTLPLDPSICRAARTVAMTSRTPLSRS